MAAVLLPVLLTLCSRPSYEPRPVYMLNCRLINSGHWMFRQHCKAESREPARTSGKSKKGSRL